MANLSPIAKRVNGLPVRFSLLSVSMLTVMASATIAPSLPAMRQHFAAVPNADYWVRLVLTLPALFIAVSAPLIGVSIDRLGRKPLLVGSLALYALAGSSGLWLTALNSILWGRALLGLSVAGIMVTATALIADYYTGAARGQFLGWQAAFTALGGVAFLSLGGWLADLNWRDPFLIYFVALPFLPCVLLFLPEPPRSNSRTILDPIPDDPASLPVGLVALTYGIALLTQIVFYTIPVQIPFYLQELFNATASQSGMAIALCTLCSAIASFQYQRLKSRLTFFGIYGIAFLNMALGYGVLSIASTYAIVLVGLAIAGLGLGLLMPNMNLCLTSSTPSTFRGRILGGLTTSFFFGQFLSPVISQPLSQAYGLNRTYGIAGAAMAVLAAIALAIVMRDRASLGTAKIR
ncbi:MFS transporter [Microcoleus sp. herbarium14]|uniref:MFS transporter n=1 Tax=Microcoleus sp. herbarium14 TaxID=3055439 RepID=UPI002FD7709D